MVATRNHPNEFPPPPPTTNSNDPRESPAKRDSPAKRSSRSTTATSSSSAVSADTPPSTTTTSETIKRTAQKSLTSATDTITSAPRLSRASTTTTSPALWTHTPSNLTLLWLLISLPLVTWDMCYVLLRPHSMPGGALHKPLWTPYALYGTVDYVYGLKAVEEKNGWTAAQTWVNVVETAVYVVYLVLVWRYGREDEGRNGVGAPGREKLEGWFGGGVGRLGGVRTVRGGLAGWCVLLGFGTANVTFWKTVLYWLLEALNGFVNIGHNDASTLLFLWIIPNGLWLVFPAYMIYVFGQEILQGLEIAATTPVRKFR
ncbi:hypothetical protein EJ03DRAFT_320472 [Teratosphaeria nubilosa]|uniref:EXPERA domain-containing protein n=1 Tax=Teratosphaeria nubilosa TaxID=161662 RepID=A0A6G1KW82_9PEZI|nr:hypothetical protein EJ03DRAFT_320472 [Teratosphaeria nubilosa]